MRQLHDFAHRARHTGVHLWRTARHYGRIVDRYVQNAAYIYGSAIQPGLSAAGVHTGDIDSKLLKTYDVYSQFRDNLKDGVQLGDSLAAHLRHY